MASSSLVFCLGAVDLARHPISGETLEKPSISGRERKASRKEPGLSGGYGGDIFPLISAPSAEAVERRGRPQNSAPESRRPGELQGLPGCLRRPPSPGEEEPREGPRCGAGGLRRGPGPVLRGGEKALRGEHPEERQQPGALLHFRGARFSREGRGSPTSSSSSFLVSLGFILFKVGFLGA